MERRRIKNWLGVGLLLSVLFLPGWAGAVQLDLNDFFQFPASAIDVMPDGSMADFVEDPVSTPVFLSNDPGLGDPNVIIPGIGVHLLFDFVFIEGANNFDEFGAFVIDVATGLSIGSAFEFFMDSSGSGTIDWDLTSLSGQTLGLQFQLSALAGDVGLDSTLRVSNVQLLTQAVPEPSSIILIGICLTIFGWQTVAYHKLNA